MVAESAHGRPQHTDASTRYSATVPREGGAWAPTFARRTSGVSMATRASAPQLQPLPWRCCASRQTPALGSGSTFQRHPAQKCSANPRDCPLQRSSLRRHAKVRSRGLESPQEGFTVLLRSLIPFYWTLPELQSVSPNHLNPFPHPLCSSRFRPRPRKLVVACRGGMQLRAARNGHVPGTIGNMLVTEVHDCTQNLIQSGLYEQAHSLPSELQGAAGARAESEY